MGEVLVARQGRFAPKPNRAVEMPAMEIDECVLTSPADVCCDGLKFTQCPDFQCVLRPDGASVKGTASGCCGDGAAIQGAPNLRAGRTLVRAFETALIRPRTIALGAALNAVGRVNAAFSGGIGSEAKYADGLVDSAAQSLDKAHTETHTVAFGAPPQVRSRQQTGQKLHAAPIFPPVAPRRIPRWAWGL